MRTNVFGNPFQYSFDTDPAFFTVAAGSAFQSGVLTPQFQPNLGIDKLHIEAIALSFQAYDAVTNLNAGGAIARVSLIYNQSAVEAIPIITPVVGCYNGYIGVTCQNGQTNQIGCDHLIIPAANNQKFFDVWIEVYLQTLNAVNQTRYQCKVTLMGTYQ